MASKLLWISEQWLNQRKSELSITKKTCKDGSVNPNYTAAVNRIEAAQYHLDAKNALIAAAIKAGYKQNQYDGKCVVSGVDVKSFGGFVKKNDAGKWQTYHRDVVIELLGISVVNLPEVA